MSKNVTQKLIAAHLREGRREAGQEIGLAIDQTNLLNFGILPLTFADPADWERVDQEDVLVLYDVRDEIQRGNRMAVFNKTKREPFQATHGMTDRQVEMVLAGSLINLTRERRNRGKRP